MTKLVMRREGTRLSCPSPDWLDLLMDLPEGVDLNVTATRARSLPQLGTYWGALQFAIDNSERISMHWPHREQLSAWLQLEVNFCDPIAFPTEHGTIIARVPKSKSFSECSQDRFNAYMTEAMDRLGKEAGFDVVGAYLEHMKDRSQLRRRAA